MAIEIGPGWTIGGGISILEPPSGPPESTAGWFGGGYQPAVPHSLSSVDRITYATDTATASVRGPLSLARYGLKSTSNTTYGWYAGGYAFTRVDRITYATDTATASVRGSLIEVLLNAGVYIAAAAGNTTDGWFGGGYGGGGQGVTTVQRITYATDTATASIRGPLTYNLYLGTATGNETNGWFAASIAVESYVQRITYATDTATASIRGPLSLGRYGLAAAGNTTNGWFAGGQNSNSAGRTSLVDRITYATDTATASVRGPLNSTKYDCAAAGNSTDGWFAGGTAASVNSTVERITYATDTNTASTRGPLSSAKYLLTGSSGIQ
jgi:hypothetical protein